MSEDIRAQVMSPIVRIGRSSLDIARVFKDPVTKKENGEPKFSLSMIVDDVSKFNRDVDGTLAAVNVTELCKELAAQKWPNLTIQEMFPKKPNGDRDWPIKKGDEIIALNAKKPKPAKLDHLKDKVQIGASAKAEYPPRLSYIDPMTKKPVDLDRDNPEDMKKIKKLFLPGNYVKTELSIVPNEVNGKCYVTFYLNHVRFMKEGERINGGGSSMMDRFDGIDGGEGNFDPTADEDFGDI